MFEKARLPRSLRCALVSLLAGLLLGACSAPDAAQPGAFQRSYPRSSVTRLSISLETVDLTIEGVAGETLSFVVQGLPESELQFTLGEDGLLQLAAGNAPSLPGGGLASVQAAIPPEVDVELRTEAGSIELSNLSGRLELETVSADTLASGLQGVTWLRSARGAISVRDSQGELHLLGQGRPVDIHNCHGRIAATTIMGEIGFSGLLGAGDRLQLESDHGGISLQLAAGSSAVFALASVNGPIQCTLPGLMGTGADCSAAYGGGAGQVTVRTVTGPIRISGME